MGESDPEAPKLVGCKQPNTKKSFMAFHHEGLNDQFALLQANSTRQLVQEDLRALVDPSPVEKGSVPVGPCIKN